MNDDTPYRPPENASPEEAACHALAWMMNRLDPEPLFSMLAPDVIWESQAVFLPLKGRDAVTRHLAGKMDRFRAERPAVTLIAELGRIGDERGQPVWLFCAAGTPCVLIYQAEDIEQRVPGGLAMVEVEDGLVRRLDFCTVVPRASMAERTGIFPGLPGSPFEEAGRWRG